MRNFIVGNSVPLPANLLIWSFLRSQQPWIPSWPRRLIQHWLPNSFQYTNTLLKIYRLFPCYIQNCPPLFWSYYNPITAQTCIIFANYCKTPVIDYAYAKIYLLIFVCKRLFCLAFHGLFFHNLRVQPFLLSVPRLSVWIPFPFFSAYIMPFHNYFCGRVLWDGSLSCIAVFAHKSAPLHKNRAHRLSL